MRLVLLALVVGCATPAERGEALYGTYCGLCHGADGEGYLAPQANALANPTFLASATDAFLAEGTTWGRPDTKMSPWGEVAGGPLTAAEVDDLVVFMRTWATLPPVDVHDRVVDGDAAAGATLYAEHCAACHGAAGEGDSALSLDNPEFLRTASDGFLRYALEVGRPGTPMPAFDDLGDVALDDLVAFLRSLEAPG